MDFLTKIIIVMNDEKLNKYRELLTGINICPYTNVEFQVALFEQLEKSGVYQQNNLGIVADEFLIDLDKRLCYEQFKRTIPLLKLIRTNPELFKNSFGDADFRIEDINVVETKRYSNTKYETSFVLFDSSAGYTHHIKTEEFGDYFKINHKHISLSYYSDEEFSSSKIQYNYNNVFSINNLIQSLSTIYWLIEEELDNKSLSFKCEHNCQMRCKNCENEI